MLNDPATEKLPAADCLDQNRPNLAGFGQQSFLIFAALLLLALGLTIASFFFPTLESADLLFALCLGLFVSITHRRFDLQLRESSRFLLNCCTLSCGILLLTALTDSWDISLLGKGKDGETGLLLGIFVTLPLLLRRVVKEARNQPRAAFAFISFVLLLAPLAVPYWLADGCEKTMPWLLPLVLISLLLLCLAAIRTLAAVVDSSTLIKFAGLAIYALLSINWAWDHDTSLSTLLTGVTIILIRQWLVEQWRETDTLLTRIGLAIGIGVGVSGGLIPLLGLPKGLGILLTFFLSSSPIYSYLVAQLELISVSAYWSILTLMGFCGLVISGSKDLTPLLAGGLQGAVALLTVPLAMLHLIRRRRLTRGSLIWVDGQQVLSARTLRHIVTLTSLVILVFATFLPLRLLIENSSPSRFLAEREETPFWPGLPLFITLAMHDDYLFNEASRWLWPRAKYKFEIISDLAAGTPDHFSYYDTAAEVAESSGRAQTVVPKFGELGCSYVWEKNDCRVTLVKPSSGAAQGGLRRGDLIRKVNGVSVGKELYIIETLTKKPGESIRVSIERAGKQQDLNLRMTAKTTDLPISRLLPGKAAPIGYLYLASFHFREFSGIPTAIKAFETAGVRELILDLRYNSGGDIELKSQLAGYLAGRKNAGKVLAHYRYNRKYRDRNFDETIDDTSQKLDLQRLLVLTTRKTCSASEGLINGLRPYLQVQTVGGTTCGKPMMMDPIIIGETENLSRLNLVSAEMNNVAGIGGYFSGIKPDCPAVDDPTHELGDPQEGMVKTALQLLATGECRDKRELDRH